MTKMTEVLFRAFVQPIGHGSWSFASILWCLMAAMGIYQSIKGWVSSERDRAYIDGAGLNGALKILANSHVEIEQTRLIISALFLTVGVGAGLGPRPINPIQFHLSTLLFTLALLVAETLFVLKSIREGHARQRALNIERSKKEKEQAKRARSKSTATKA